MKLPALSALCLLSLAAPAAPPSEARLFEARAKALALECRDEAARRMEALITSGRLSQAQLFDTFYIPIKDTYPQKFHTQYDRVFDEVMQGFLDDFLHRNPRFVYVVLTDQNGYVPTHNSVFSRPLTGNRELDAKGNRTKQMFNDRTGLAAARSTAPFLLQDYQRDTGEAMTDLSAPLAVRGQHWGCVRVGYRKD